MSETEHDAIIRDSTGKWLDVAHDHTAYQVQMEINYQTYRWRLLRPVILRSLSNRNRREMPLPVWEYGLSTDYMQFREE